MYKVLYIGFLTFQLISVFCNLKSSKKDILEAHNSRKFNIIGIVCQIIAVIFIMIILKMQGWRVKKYIVHFIIWGLGIISYYILDKTTAGDEFQNISVLLIGCLMFLWSVLYFYDIRNQENWMWIEWIGNIWRTWHGDFNKHV